jgi:hypothetical protein
MGLVMLLEPILTLKMLVKSLLAILRIPACVRYPYLQIELTIKFGDLAGKFGNMTSDPFTLDVLDEFISFDPSNIGYFLGRSVVIHSNAGVRIACAK